MLKYEIIKNNVVTNTWTSDFSDETYYEPGFGLPERWVPEIELSEEQKNSSLDIRESIDEIGNKFHEYLLKAEYEVRITDITSEILETQKKLKIAELIDTADSQIKAMMNGAEFTTRLGEALYLLDMALNLSGEYSAQQVSEAKAGLVYYRNLMNQIQGIRADRDAKIAELG